MQQSAAGYSDDLKSTKAEMADMNRRIMRLQSEIDMVKAQVRITVNHTLIRFYYNDFVFYFLDLII